MFGLVQVRVLPPAGPDTMKVPEQICPCVLELNSNVPENDLVVVSPVRLPAKRSAAYDPVTVVLSEACASNI